MENRKHNQFMGFLNTPTSIYNFKELIGLSNFNFEDIPSLKLLSEINTISFPTNLVLGKRIELFFKYAINISESFKLIASNIQIQNKERTIGEIDFIIKDLKRSQVLHIELMYKFYIYDPDITEEMGRWIGPNRKDSMLQKLDKVKINQFALLYTEEAKEYLKSLNLIAEEIQQQICFKATLFIPEYLQDHTFDIINKECIAGFWFHLKDFGKYDEIDFQFFTPEKQDWPIDPKYGETWYNYKEILDSIIELHSRKKSPLVWVRKPKGKFERIIVVWW